MPVYFLSAIICNTYRIVLLLRTYWFKVTQTQLKPSQVHKENGMVCTSGGKEGRAGLRKGYVQGLSGVSRIPSPSTSQH